MARFKSRLPNITYYFRSTNATAARFQNHIFETDDPEMVEAITSHPHYGRDIVGLSLDGGSPDEGYTCYTCGKSFKSVHALHAHQGRTGHGGDA